jgi:hypothetical protein
VSVKKGMGERKGGHGGTGATLLYWCTEVGDGSVGWCHAASEDREGGVSGLDRQAAPGRQQPEAVWSGWVARRGHVTWPMQNRGEAVADQWAPATVREARGQTVYTVFKIRMVQKCSNFDRSKFNLTEFQIF